MKIMKHPVPLCAKEVLNSVMPYPSVMAILEQSYITYFDTDRRSGTRMPPVTATLTDVL